MREELEAKLREHRSTKDRSALLQERMQANRAERPSQKEREAELRATDTDTVFQDFVANFLGSANRLVGISGEGVAARHDVSAAISFRTGILSLDHALGGGIATGVSELYGVESVGKTTLLAHMVKGAQQQGLRTVLCPTELFDGRYYKKVGVDLEELVIVRGKGEDALNAILDLLEEEPMAVFLDSASGLRPVVEDPLAWLDMMLQFIEYAKDEMSLGSSVVMTNQVRARRSIDPKRMFAGGTDSTARKIVSLFNTRLELTRESVTEDSYDMMVNVVANEYAPPSRFISLPVVKGKGIDVWKDVLRAAVAVGVIEQKGSWYHFGGDAVGQGEEQASRHLELARSEELLEAVVSRVF